MAGRILLATRSGGKLKEFAVILGDLGVDYTDLREIGIAEAPEEDELENFATFEENALAKARYFNRLTGIATIADDSGLMVDALGGAPGVITKRWSGRSDLSGQALDDVNNEKLLREMRRAEAEQGSISWSGSYVSVAAFVDGDFELTRRGELRGEIIEQPRGSGGFGYDPYFLAPELGGTFAESSWENTARKSHRSKSVRALVAALRAEGRIG
jgi:Xanthosine triphosphate pyrophosphatase